MNYLLISAQLLDTTIQIHGLGARGIMQLSRGVFDRPGRTSIHAESAFAAPVLNGSTCGQGQISEHSGQADPGTELRGDQKEGFTLPAEPGMQSHGFVGQGGHETLFIQDMARRDGQSLSAPGLEKAGDPDGNVIQQGVNFSIMEGIQRGGPINDRIHDPVGQANGQGDRSGIALQQGRRIGFNPGQTRSICHSR